MILHINVVLCFLFYSTTASPLFTGSSSDAQSLSTGEVYSWGQWKLVPENDALYMWSDVAALKLSKDSNGYFYFLLDGKVSVMYSIGSYGDSDRSMFLDELQPARNSVTHKALRPVLSKPGTNKLVYGTWTLTSEKENELLLEHSGQGPQTTILRKDLAGFIFVPTQHEENKLLTAETLLDDLPELAMEEQTSPSTSPAPDKDDIFKGQCGEAVELTGDVFSFGKWLMVRSIDDNNDEVVYVWSDAVALELRLNCNGWFNYFLDGNKNIMWSIGDHNVDSGRSQYIEGLKRASATVKSTPPQPILTKPGCTKLKLGNWIISSEIEKEFLIRNTLQTHQKTILKEDLDGFVFQPTSEKQELVLKAGTLLNELPEFAEEKLLLATVLNPNKPTENLTPANDDNSTSTQLCGSECSELATAADSDSSLYFGGLVGEELHRFPQSERLQVMVSILTVIQEYAQKQGMSCTADVEDNIISSPVN